MRKLKPAEVIALAAVLSVGGLADAQDYEELPVTNLNGTTTVYTQYHNYDLWHSYAMWFSDSPPAGGYGGVVNLPAIPVLAVRQKVANCVVAYGPYTLPPGWALHYSARFAWSSPNFEWIYYTPTNQQPIGNWEGRGGGTRVGEKAIYIYAGGYSSFEIHFRTIAHELAHANGVGYLDDSIAENIAYNAYINYLADGGAKCGGLS